MAGGASTDLAWLALDPGTAATDSSIVLGSAVGRGDDVEGDDDDDDDDDGLAAEACVAVVDDESSGTDSLPESLPM
jgi:hypothetical protein